MSKVVKTTVTTKTVTTETTETTEKPVRTSCPEPDGCPKDDLHHVRTNFALLGAILVLCPSLIPLAIGTAMVADSLF